MRELRRNHQKVTPLPPLISNFPINQSQTKTTFALQIYYACIPLQGSDNFLARSQRINLTFVALIEFRPKYIYNENTRMYQ